MYQHVSIVPSLSIIVTLDDEVPVDKDKQLDISLISIWNDSFPSCILSSLIFILTDDDNDPVEMVTLKICVVV